MTNIILRPDDKTLGLMLSKAKGRMFLMKGAGFLGALLCNHQFVWDDTMPTAWCNGKKIGLNTDFFLSLSVDARVALLAHEMWHTGYSHHSRMGTRDPSIWNFAADYIINNNLDDSGYAVKELGNILLDHKYDGMTTEQVYDILFQQSEPVPVNYGKSVNPVDFTGDIKEAPSESEKTSAMISVVRAVQSAIASDEAGTIPGEITILIEEFLYPVLPWEQLLSRFMTEFSKDDYSMKRPSRRHEDEYLPSMIADNGLEHLIYYLDVSGSVIDEDIARFNSEVRFIHREMTPQRLTLVTFDTKLRDLYEFEADSPFENIQVTGRGGTSLAPVYDHIMEKKPTAAIVFSDMCCKPMEDPNIPMLWVTIGKHGHVPTFGQIVKMKDYEKKGAN